MDSQRGETHRAHSSIKSRRTIQWLCIIVVVSIMNSFLCHASRASTTRRLSRPTAWIHQIPSTTRRSILIQQSTTSSHQASLSRPNHVSRPLAFASSVRWMSDSSKEDETSVTPSDKSNTKRRSSKKKFKVVDSIEQHHVDKLAQAFDEMARKEGFTSDTAFFADESVFDDDDDEAFIDDDEDDDDDPLFFPSDDDDNDDMEARIAAARQDIVSGQVTVPKELDSFAGEVSADELRKLGFRREANPFGDDETPRKEQFKLVTNALVCPACGAGFQCHKESRPGFLPPEKFEVQVKLSKIEELQTLKEKADAEDEWSAEDEIEWLIQSSESSAKPPDGESDVGDIDIEEMAEDLGLDLAEVSKRQVVCKRCHELQNFGKVAETLRPGWTSEPLLSQEKFRELLRPIRDKKAVLIALVDLFDFSGSVLPELDNIAGENPVILAANKADLLPSSMGKVRAENWVRRELEYLGVRSLANIGGAVRLVSCKTGMGVGEMMTKARALAEEMDCDIYVVGAANAGKSTLLNHILASPSNAEGSPEKKKIRAGNRNSRKGVLTTSPLPGTTLEFIKVDLGGRNLFDTPGLLVDGTLTQLLTPEELKIVVPKK